MCDTISIPDGEAYARICGKEVDNTYDEDEEETTDEMGQANLE